MTRKPFTADEDELLIELKEDHELPWQGIHEEFTEVFPWRSVGALKMRYSTKLRGGRLGKVGGQWQRDKRACGSPRTSVVDGWTEESEDELA